MAVVRNIQNNDVYFYLGENKFKNLRTQKEGVVTDEQAKDIFKINLEATELISEYPLISEFINKCNLKFDNNKK